MEHSEAPSAVAEQLLIPEPQLKAIVEALENSGVTRIKRSDGVWETLIQRNKDTHTVATRIFGLLLPATRKALESPYLKATTADQLVRELNGMLRRRDFFSAAACVLLASGPR